MLGPHSMLAISLIRGARVPFKNKAEDKNGALGSLAVCGT